MRTFKNFINNLFNLQPPAGDYIATIINVKVKYLKETRLSLVTIKYTLKDVNTGVEFTYRETFIDNFYLLRYRDFIWFLESHGVIYVDYFGLVDAVFDISITQDCIFGKKVPVIIYNDIITPPCILDERKVD